MHVHTHTLYLNKDIPKTSIVLYTASSKYTRKLFVFLTYKDVPNWEVLLRFAYFSLQICSL